MPLSTEYTDDGQMIKVCLTENGLKACCFVSSEHLVAEKEKHLRAAIARMAWRAVVGDC
jgi:ATP-dependent helicase YprA (DUF1998 family)